LTRYTKFLDEEYLAGLVKPDEYSLEGVQDDLRQAMAGGRFKRIVFTGMGCSAIVSDVIRAYFVEICVPLDVYVMNDYESSFLVPDSILNDEATLIVISSYSGHSTEPILAFERFQHALDRVLLLTSGGRLAEVGRDVGASIAYWRLREPDREYPLFHVTQYFAILMEMFYRLGMMERDHREELAELAQQLRSEMAPEQIETARRIAITSLDANITMIGSPRWYESLLKLCKMHLNEIAMVPATRNYLHEFCHSEIASLSDSERSHSVLVFADADDDDYTQRKTKNLIGLLSESRPENRNVVVHRLNLDQPTFLRKFFTALNLIQLITLELGREYNTRSRDLISEAAGNEWYHSTTITAEGLAVA